MLKLFNIIQSLLQLTLKNKNKTGKQEKSLPTYFWSWLVIQILDGRGYSPFFMSCLVSGPIHLWSQTMDQNVLMTSLLFLLELSEFNCSDQWDWIHDSCRRGLDPPTITPGEKNHFKYARTFCYLFIFFSKICTQQKVFSHIV